MSFSAILVVLIGLFFVTLMAASLAWAQRTGQFEDVEEVASRILEEEDA